MQTNYKGEDGKTYIVDLSRLGIIPMPKEGLKQMYDSLEPEQIGNVIMAFCEAIHGEVELELKTKVERGMFNRLISEVTRLGFGRLKSKQNLPNVKKAITLVNEETGELIENTPNNTIKKTFNKEKEDKYFCPWTDNGMSEDEYKSQLSPQELAIINLNR